MLRIGFALLITLVSLPGCAQAVEHERLRGLAVVGPHGPEFNSEADFTGEASEIYPWRMSGREPGFSRKLELAAQRASELGLASFPWIKVEFLGNEIPVSPNHHGATREIWVEEWITVEPCSVEPQKCLGE